MSTQVTTADVLHNGPQGNLLAHPMRVLAISPAEDRIWLIQLQRQHSKKKGRTRTYFRGPQLYPLSEIQAHLNDARLTKAVYNHRELLNRSKEDIIASATSRRQAKHFTKMMDDRDARWTLLLPVLSGSPDGQHPRPFLQIIADPALPALVKQRAEQQKVALTTVYSLLHQYWAQGSRKNSLCTNLWRCGCPGQPKAQGRKLGRPSRLFLNGVAGPGITLTDVDKTRLAWGYRLICHQVPAIDAFLLVSSIFWADRTIAQDGTTSTVLWPPDRRPTQRQFMYWGKLGNDDKSVQEMILGPRKWNQKAVTRGGSLQDQVSVVGQLSYFDGTSCDVYLTSLRSRLLKLPPMTRLMLSEARSEVIYGLYCGWEPPSPATAMQCILHGAEPKVHWCRRFGIDIAEDDWPSFLARNHLADNGELKAATITEAEEQFGFAVEYTPVMRGDKKGGIESQHHVLHKAVDHTAPGTTRGKRRERGEEHAPDTALWNYYEYMRELIWAILDFNNEEVLQLAPVEMLRERPDLKPTRLNIFKWLRAKGLTAELSCDLPALRAFLLPEHQALVRKNGIYLMAQIHGREQELPKLRYTSKDPAVLAMLSEVKLAGTTQRTRLRLHSSDLSIGWLTTRQGIYKLQLAGADTLLRQHLTLKDWCTWLEALTIERDRGLGGRHQARLARLLRRRQVSADARNELRDEIAQLPKKQSKQQQRRDLRVNREVEKILVKQHAAAVEADGALRAAHAPANTASCSVEVTGENLITSAADRAMQMFSESLGDVQRTTPSLTQGEN